MLKLARDKRSSLLRKFVNYGRKKFYNIGPRSTTATSPTSASADSAASTRDQCYKAFFAVIYDARVVIYDCDMRIVQASGFIRHD